jgi:hypothetical protein
VACDTGCCGDKEVKSCPVCGSGVPASLGYKPRKYCSSRCASIASKGLHLRRNQPCFCFKCGVRVDYPGRGPRSGIQCEKCLAAYCRPRRLLDQACVRCGGAFSSPYKKKFCSRRCQHNGKGIIHGDPIQCKRCGRNFKTNKANQQYCSYKCACQAKVYECLCCGVTFTRKRYKSGDYSKQSKYCSRECAFDARRRKLPCASRPLEVAHKLAGWFLEWRREAAEPPKHETIACARCGESAIVGFGSGKTMCDRCQSLRFCSECGCECQPGRRLCGQCAKDRQIKSRRENKRRRRRLCGHACTFRQRCKKYGAAYTKVSKKVVMDRANWACQICGCELLPSFTVMPGTRTPHPRCPTIDHIAPLSLGPDGPGHVLDNCQAACWKCNCLRGAEPLDSFVQRYATSLD